MTRTGSSSKPLLVLVTGLPGTGKSTVAAAAAEALGAAVLAHDWAMSGLRPYPGLQAALDAMAPSGHREVGWSVLAALARAQLRRGSSVVLDGVARRAEVEQCRGLATEEGASSVVVLTRCSDLAVHRSRIDGRARGIPNWYELDWSHVERAIASWDSPTDVDLELDAIRPLGENLELLRDGALRNWDLRASELTKGKAVPLRRPPKLA
ncbi:MAG TPA: AAA family ATPase [Acidimicrobiales bacterium]|nr:AAA family ATPase [Acidimicrobiales bacterium]